MGCLHWMFTYDNSFGQNAGYPDLWALKTGKMFALPTQMFETKCRSKVYHSKSKMSNLYCVRISIYANKSNNTYIYIYII